jgi:hypothetical protein
MYYFIRAFNYISHIEEFCVDIVQIRPQVLISERLSALGLTRHGFVLYRKGASVGFVLCRKGASVDLKGVDVVI